MKKGFKIFTITFLSLAALVIISAVILNNIVENKIENFLDTRMPDNIVPEYKTLTIDYFGGTITLDSLTVSIKNKSDKVTHTIVSVKKFIIEDVGYIDYIFKKEIHIEDIKIKEPTIVYYKDKLIGIKNSKTTIAKPVQLFKPVLVDELKIYDADFRIYDNTKDSLFLYSKNVNLEIRDILLNDSIVGQRLPVHFEKYKASADSLYMKVGKYETLNVGNFDLKDKNAKFTNINLKTKYSKQQLSKEIAIERDHFNVHVPTFTIADITFGFNVRKFFAKSSLLSLNNLSAEIFRDKLVADDPKIKPLYSKMLRDLPIDLTVDSLKIENGKISYTERVHAENMGGNINFSKINATISNVSNTYISPKKTELSISALFMDEAPLNVDWNFDVNNISDEFIFKADLGNLGSEKLNSFTKPNLNILLEGETNQTYFTIGGNYANSVIDMRIKYTDFKLSILDKDGKEKNKFLSTIANLLFSKDSEKNDESFREGSGHITRDQTKSFFNYLWLNVKEGLIRSITGIPDKIDRENNRQERREERAARQAERQYKREARKEN